MPSNGTTSTTKHTILVCGGGGYIGSHTVLVLLEAGHSVVVVDNYVNSVKGQKKPMSLERVEEITSKSVKFYDVDVADRPTMVKIMKEHTITCVMHFAALKAVAESIEQPLMYYRNNVCGTVALMEACQEAGVFNFIFSSSATVYGAPQKLPITEEDPVGIELTNPYGWTKYMAERMLMDVCVADKRWNVVLLRYFNPVGAHESGVIGEDPKGIPNNLMPYVSQVAVGKRPHVNVFGNDYDTPDGTGVRDYIHIMDLARGHSAVLKLCKEGAQFGCKVYNLGTGRGYSVIEMIKAMEKASGNKIAYEVAARRAGDIGNVYCDPALATKELGWTAKHDIDDMCTSMWKWQSGNPNGFTLK